jgi:calcium/calmodulin-dependent protein kinase I
MAASSRKCPKAVGRYVRGKLLGSGAFANVYACRDADDEEQIFAVKAVDLQAMKLSGRGDRELKKLQREASILKKVKPHANVVQFIDLVEHEDWYLFILEFVQGGNLLQSITKRQGSEPLKEHEVMSIVRQLVEGLQHLHGEAIIHRDLKLENVLVVQEGSAKREFKVKITDFGLSKEVGDGASAACSVVGSPKYVAPEVLASGEHDFKADLWSLGILLFVLLGNRFPFDGNSQAARESQDKIDAEMFKLSVTDSARSVLLGLLRLKVDERLTLESLLAHEWLTSASFQSPLLKKRRKVQNTAQDVLPPTQSTSASSREHPGSSTISPAAAASNRRRSWVDCSPEEAEANFKVKQEKLSILTAKGFNSIVAEIALQSTEWDVDEAVRKLNTQGRKKQAASSEPSCSALPSPETIAIATVPKPKPPRSAPQNRRSSWIDCTPEEWETNFQERKQKMQRLIERGFESDMAQIALQSADWNLETAIMMLEGG